MIVDMAFGPAIIEGDVEDCDIRELSLEKMPEEDYPLLNSIRKAAGGSLDQWFVRCSLRIANVEVVR